MTKLEQRDRLSFILSNSQQKNVMSIDELAEALSVTERTIRNDVGALNQELRNIAEFQLKKGRYLLRVYREDDYQEFLQTFCKEQKQLDTPQNRAKMLGTILINAIGTLKMDDLSFQLNISRSTLVNDLDRLRVTLEPYRLLIKGKPNNGIQIYGTEWHKRLYILQKDNHFYKTQQTLKKSVKDLIQQFTVENQIAESTELEFTRYIRVVLARAERHPLLENEFDQQSIVTSDEFERVDNFANKLKKLCGMTLSSSERAFLTIPILGRRSPVNILDSTSVIVPAALLHLIKDIKKQVKKELNIDLDFKKIEKELAYHLMFMLNRLVFGVEIHNSLIHEVQEKYPLACEIANIAYDVIDRDYHIQVTETELSYLAYYFGISIVENEDKTKQLRRVAIVCDTGRGSARLIALQLDKILPQNVEKGLFSSTMASAQALESYDIVFSTVPLSEDIQKPIIQVNDIFDERKLAREINRRFALNNLQIGSNKKDDSIINHLMSEDKFFILSEQKTYAENIKMMANQLAKMKYVDAQFKTRLVEREQKRQTIFDHGIAFPHAIHRANSDIVFSIGVFHHGMHEGKNFVQIVFLLGIPESHHNETLLVNLYSEVIALIHQRDWIEKISESTSCSEIKNLIRDCLVNHQI